MCIRDSPCVVPVRLDDGTVAYINLFSQKAFKYEGGKQIQIDVPNIGHRFEGLIQAMSCLLYTSRCV